MNIDNISNPITECMSPLCFEKNLKCLLSSSPYLKNIQLEKKTKELELFTTPTGLISGKYKDHYVHSRHNPGKEAIQLIDRKITENISSTLFYGFGLGYFVEAFIKKYPQIPVLIIEPDISFFLKALESRDLTFIFQSKNILYFIDPDPDNFLPFIEQLPLSNIQVIKLYYLKSNSDTFLGCSYSE